MSSSSESASWLGSVVAAAGNHFWSDLCLGYRVFFADNLRQERSKKPHRLKEMMGLLCLKIEAEA